MGEETKDTIGLSNNKAGLVHIHTFTSPIGHCGGLMAEWSCM